MKLQPIPESKSDRFSIGADLLKNRLRFLAHGILDLTEVFILTASSTWAAVAALTLGPTKAQVCFAALVAKLLPLPAGFGLALPCWLPTGIKWVSISTLQEQSLPWGFYAAGVLGAGVGVVAAAAGRRWFLRTGEAVAQPEHLRGPLVVPPEQWQAMIPNSGHLPTGEVWLPAGRETHHFFVAASTGGGKTTWLLQLLMALPPDVQALIYDPVGEITAKLWQTGDILLNIFDLRMLRWTFWAELKVETDYLTMADSLIPPDARYMAFVYPARKVVAALLKLCTSFSELRAALRLSLNKLADLLVGTIAEGIISADNRGAPIILSIINTNLNFTNFLENPAAGEPVFSIREWVRNGKGRIFMTASEDLRPILKTLICLWMDLATLELLTLPPDPNRRIFFIFEELASLPPLAALHGLVTRGRKHGGCAVLVTQDPGQLATIYGSELAQTLLQNCGTWVIFRCNNAQAARFLADQVGQFEQIEKTKSLSVGPGDAARDGASYTAQRVIRPALLPSELQTLPDLTGFLLLHGDFPRTKIHLTYQDLPEVAPAFLLNPKFIIPAKGVPALPLPDSLEPEAPSQGNPLPVQSGKAGFKSVMNKFKKSLEK